MVNILDFVDHMISDTIINKWVGGRILTQVCLDLKPLSFLPWLSPKYSDSYPYFPIYARHCFSTLQKLVYVILAC